MAALRKLLIVLTPILLIVAALEFFFYTQVNRLIHPPQKKESVDPKDLLLSANEIQFHSSENMNLHGWLILGKPGYPAMILAHDHGSNRALTLARLESLITGLNKQGYFVFLFDFRGHGESGKVSTLGIREASDLEAALQAVLKYKQIGRRIGVLGVGMGAVAASRALQSVDEVKLVVFDSIYENIPGRYAERLVEDYPILANVRPVLNAGFDWNLRLLLRVPTTEQHLDQEMPRLYPKTLLFVEKKPARPEVVALYESAREPKELLQLGETAADELIGDARQIYTQQLIEKIGKYLPPVSNDKTIELPK